MNRIAFVTTCKNRLHHLQQTLPLWVAEGPDEIVVVDYGCPQGTGDWVEANWPQVTVVRVDDDPGFCVARARNLGAAVVESEWICFIDADIFVAAGWVTWMREHLNGGCFYRAAPVNGVREPEIWGTVIVQQGAWREIGGYDEFFFAWGGEDADLYDRLAQSGRIEHDYPNGYVGVIHHSDEERFAYSKFKSKRDNRSFHNFYRYAKYVWMTVAGVAGDLPVEQKKRLRGLVDEAFAPIDGHLPKRPEIVFDVELVGAWLPQARRKGARCRCILQLERERRVVRRMTRFLSALRSFVTGSSSERPEPEGVDLDTALVRTVLSKLEGAPASSPIRAESSTVMRGMPSKQRVRVICQYELPAVADAS